MKIDKENSDDLGFALSALACQAITIDEFKEWVGFVIGNFQYPEEFVDLLDAQFIVDACKAIPFTPTLADREAIEKALYGVAYSRFSGLFDASVPEPAAREALSQRGDVLDRFRETFPFIIP